MLARGCFVTGTDTGIGKTVVSAVLTVGLGATYWKPVQTGAREGADSDFVRAWVGEERVARECYVFSDPVSPHLAARDAGVAIKLRQILLCASELPSPLVVEGAGGVLVPLSAELLLADLIGALKLPVVISTSTKLGTINHTLLTLEALRARRIPVAGVVMVGEERGSPWRSIEAHGAVTVLGHIPPAQCFSHVWFRHAFENLSLPAEQEAPCTIP
jgi:dethiobiotin synthase